MKLVINTPAYETEYHVAWLEINTPTGNYVIQKGHAPAIMALTPASPIVFRLKTGKQETLTVKTGLAKIDRESATIIMTVAEQ